MNRKGRPEDVEGRLESFFQAERSRLRAPADLWDRLEPRLDLLPAREGLWPGIRRWFRAAQPAYAGAAAALVLLVGGVVTWQVAFTGPEGAPAPGVATEQDGGSQAATVERELDGRAGGAPEKAGAAASPQGPVASLMTEDAAPPSAGAWAAIQDQSSSSGGVTLLPLRAVVKGDAYGVVVYALVAPEHLEGWRLNPSDVAVQMGAEEGVAVLSAVPLASVGRVSVGAVSFPLSGEEAGDLVLRIRGMVATRATTGEGAAVAGGGWSVTPLRRGEGAADALQMLGLRSTPCLAEAGVTLDLADGAGCPREEGGDLPQGTGPDPGQVPEQGTLLRLVFHGPPTNAITVVVDAAGRVQILPQ